jgi:ribosomal protein S18 acetylase RimI-like enzyme
MGVRELTGTAIQRMRRRGLRGVASELRKRVGWVITRTVYARQDHVWCWYGLRAEKLEVPLPDGFTVSRVGPDGLGVAEQLGATRLEEARRCYGDGGCFWVACNGGAPASGFWVFEDKLPVFAARSGWLSLPHSAIALENALTAPGYRRLGVALAMLAIVARHYAEQGCTDILVKTEVDNVPVRTGMRKAGFSEIASMNLLKIGPWRRVRISPTGNGNAAMAKYLSAELATRIGA